MVQEYIKLAVKSVKTRQLRSILTILGVFIGIAAVVALVSLSQGLKNAVADQFTKLGSDKILVQAASGGFGPPGTAVTVPLTLKDKKALEQVSSINLVVGRLIRTVQVESHNQNRYTYSTSLPDTPKERSLIIEINDYQLLEGRFFERSNAREIIIGYNLQKDFFDNPLILRNKVKIQGEEFIIVGILKESGNPQRDNTIIIPEDSMREILNVPEAYDLLAATINSGETLATASEDAKKQLRKTRNVEIGKEDFTIQTPEQLLGTLTTILNIIQGVLVGIAAISLLIGGIGIMNTMYTAVIERTREIGIMKSIGATPKNIMIIFLIESGLLGLIGGIIGVILGISLAKIVEFAAYQSFGSSLIQATISPTVIIGALFFATIVGAISGAFPARQAAKLNPVDALRK